MNLKAGFNIWAEKKQYKDYLAKDQEFTFLLALLSDFGSSPELRMLAAPVSH